MNYSEKLKDPRWQKKRLRVMERDEFTCKYCKNDKKQLHVHHVKYEFNDPWETDSRFLETVCASCHEVLEKVKEDGLIVSSIIYTKDLEFPIVFSDKGISIYNHHKEHVILMYHETFKTISSHYFKINHSG